MQNFAFSPRLDSKTENPPIGTLELPVQNWKNFDNSS